MRFSARAATADPSVPERHSDTVVVWSGCGSDLLKWIRPLETVGNVLLEGGDQLFHEAGDRSHDLVGEGSSTSVSVERELKMMIDEGYSGVPLNNPHCYRHPYLNHLKSDEAEIITSTSATKNRSMHHDQTW